MALVFVFQAKQVIYKTDIEIKSSKKRMVCFIFEFIFTADGFLQ